MLKQALLLFSGPAFFALAFVAGIANENIALFIVIGMALWMISWWVTDVVPMAATSLLPVIVLTASGLLTVKEATSNYANPTIYLFLGGFVIAIGMEKSGLHKRIALNILKFTGKSANSIVLGFLLATAFISMWVSNTATTLMMLPIAASISAIMHAHANSGSNHSIANFDTSLMLGVAYAANIGGAATLIGTPPNVVLAGLMRDLLQVELSFGSFMLMGVPLMLLLLAMTYWILVKLFYPNRIGNVESLNSVINLQLRDLGGWSKREKAVACIFGCVAFLWIFGQPLNTLWGQKIFDDTTVAILGALLMFVFPIQLKEKDFVINWSDTQKLPWEILLLFGGGLSLAEGMNKVGLMKILGDAVMQNLHLSPILLMLLLTFIMLMMTELMSNVALATIFIPVVVGIAQSTNSNPIAFAVAVAVASSHAFMLPIGTPPNAIVYGTGKITVKQMVKAGFILNLIAVLAIVALVHLFYGT